MTVFEASFRHPDGWPVLSITASPQTMLLTVTNRSAFTVKTTLRRRVEFTLLFRPGVLKDVDRLVLAPESSKSWTLTSGTTEQGIELRFVAQVNVKLAAGSAIAIRLDGVSAESIGGSRATRLELRAANFVLDEPSKTPVAEPCLIHLSVLRRHESSEMTLRQVRTGSVAMAGPFIAGILGGHGLINDGVTPNVLRLRIVNVGDSSLPMSVDGDQATRFTLSYPVGTESVPWGLLGSRFDHVSIEVDPGSIEQWEVDRHTVRRIEAKPWRRGDHLDLLLTVHTNAPIGRAQIIATFEDLPGHDDDDLVTLVDVGTWSLGQDVLRATTRMEIRSERPTLTFANTSREVAESNSDPSLVVDAIGRMTAEAQGGFYVAGALTVDGPARILGSSYFAGPAEFADTASFAAGFDVLAEPRFHAPVTGPFDVRGNSTAKVHLTAEPGRAIIAALNDGDSDLPSPPLVINPDGGSVGIGRSPLASFLLDVAGNVFVEGVLSIGHWRLYERQEPGSSQLIVYYQDEFNPNLGSVVLAEQRFMQ